MILKLSNNIVMDGKIFNEDLFENYHFGMRIFFQY